MAAHESQPALVLPSLETAAHGWCESYPVQGQQITDGLSLTQAVKGRSCSVQDRCTSLSNIGEGNRMVMQ
ncbi:UNVERIFIED_CONTAM: hypothetical protein K2H54_040350 [Gekko kuhli]